MSATTTYPAATTMPIATRRLKPMANLSKALNLRVIARFYAQRSSGACGRFAFVQ